MDTRIVDNNSSNKLFDSLTFMDLLNQNRFIYLQTIAFQPQVIQAFAAASRKSERLNSIPFVPDLNGF